MRMRTLVYPCLLGAVAWPSTTHAAPGDLFVTESVGGSVLEFGDGGDLSAAPRFATGLQQPTGICRGPDGHIYVVETVPGEITIIDDGGDMTDVEPFAYGVPNIIGLWCSDELVLTGILFDTIGVVINVTAGGYIPDIPLDQVRFAQSPALATSVVVNGANMYVLGGDVWDITGGGDHTLDPAYTSGVFTVTGTTHAGMALAGQYQAPNVYDFTAGGDLTLVTPWATLPDHGLDGVSAIVDGGEAGVFATIGNEIYAITGGGDFSDTTPFATGLNAGLNGEDPLAGIEGMLHHVCSTIEDCSDGDLCNGDEQCVNNACVLAEGPLDCDDADICTADSCDAVDGCSNEPIENCCHDDFDCAIDEVCDGETDECVPTDPTGGESSGGDPPTDDSGGESDDSTGGATLTSGDPPPGSGSDGSSSGADDDGGAAASESGCSCTTGSTGPGALGFVVVAGLVLRRRRVLLRG